MVEAYCGKYELLDNSNLDNKYKIIVEYLMALS